MEVYNSMWYRKKKLNTPDEVYEENRVVHDIWCVMQKVKCNLVLKVVWVYP